MKRRKAKTATIVWEYRPPKPVTGRCGCGPQHWSVESARHPVEAQHTGRFLQATCRSCGRHWWMDSVCSKEVAGPDFSPYTDLLDAHGLRNSGPAALEVVPSLPSLPPDSVRIPIGISYWPQEESPVGCLTLDRTALRAEIEAILQDARSNQTASAGEDPDLPKLLANHSQQRLGKDLGRWLSRHVLWDWAIRRMQPEAFLTLVERQPWDASLLGVPAVQEQVAELRKHSHATRNRLGKWLMGTTFGKPRTVDSDWIRWKSDRDRRHLRGFAKVLKWKEGKTRTNSLITRWDEAAKSNPILAERLEHAGLKEFVCQEIKRRDAVETIANRLVAHEEGTTPSTVRRYSRQAPITTSNRRAKRRVGPRTRTVKKPSM